MVIDNTIDNSIGERLLKLNDIERENRISSGKLTAGMLGWPVQWQWLKVNGTKPKPPDTYLIRKFKRGNDIEDWLVSMIDGVIEKQKQVEYRDCVGVVDAVVDTTGYEHEVGVIPHEVKSVTNAKFRRVTKGPDEHHILQACFYALALKTDWFAIDYVASDDLRVKTYVIKTSTHKHQVIKAIEEFNRAIKSKEVPKFKAKYKWQEDKKYNMYPEYM